MPPKTSDMKQKSLMSFFGKPVDANKTPSNKLPGTSKVHSSSGPKFQPLVPKTPITKSKETLVSSKTTPSSSADNGARSDKDKSVAKDTPPTSDAIDVDMLSGEEESNERVQVAKVRPINSFIRLGSSWIVKTRVKRKLFIEDSEDESPVKKAAPAPSSPDSPVIGSTSLYLCIYVHFTMFLISFHFFRTSKETACHGSRDWRRRRRVRRYSSFFQLQAHKIQESWTSVMFVVILCQFSRTY